MKKLSLILVIVLIASCLGSGLTSVAFAATPIAFDNTDVLDDLNDSRIAGEQFDAANYGYSKERQAQVLTFAEYGFNYDSDKQNYYGLYAYVYNPSGQVIGTENNKITIATVYENGQAVDYDKFDLLLLSVSDGEYANLFYKFKVANVSKILSRVSVNTNLRRYDVGEIELNFGNVEAYTVGNYYEYSGFAKGCGADTDADSTLTCKSNSTETLMLDVKSTYYRYNNGVETQSVLSGVYFGVPTKTLDTYGNGKLQQIKANWFETRTAPQVVLNNKALYQKLKEYIGSDDTADLSEFGYNGLVAGTGQVLTAPLYGYGKYPKPAFGMYVPPLKLDWLFYAPEDTVSASEIIRYAEDYTSKFGGELLLDKYSKNLMTGYADRNRQEGWQGANGEGIVIDADSSFDVDGFKESSKFLTWFYNLLYDGLENDTIKDVDPIYIVKESDVAAKTADEIAENLLIDKADVAEFIQTYNLNKVSGKKTVLFRFAVTDYDVYELKAIHYDDFWGTTKSDTVGYVAQQTVFLDFDIIWLKFVKGDVETVISTVSSPIDVVNGLNPPPETNDPFEWLKNFIEWLKENWWVLLVALGVALLVVFLAVDVLRKGLGTVFKAVGKGLWYLIKYLFIGLGYILASPVLLVIWIVRKVKDR
ncbi:MAG: hypothetical protein NC332_04360 [Firmicutes bacterium]|nr:hypothetical protein [Bacillota bacterium]